MDRKLSIIAEAYNKMMETHEETSITPESFFRIKTDIPYYDNLLAQGKAEVVLMRPCEYMLNALKIFQTRDPNVSMNDIDFKIRRSKGTIEKLKSIKTGVDMPLLDFKRSEQEGIRRMHVAEQLFGPMAEFPVLVAR